MTTIGIMYHNEDIHNIIQHAEPPSEKPPRFKSKQKTVKPVTQKSEGKMTNFRVRTGKYNGHQTFGLAHYEPPESWNYLKKKKPADVPAPPKTVEKKEYKSSLPKMNKETVVRPPKNFIKENIKKAAELEPKKPRPRRVETPRGTVREMGHLIQMIKIRESNRYGQLPKYLCDMRRRWKKEENIQKRREKAIQEYKEKMGIGTRGMGENVMMVDQETRQKIIDGLKENWNELSKQFLKLPVMCDTLFKIKRKMYLEKEIDQLEKDVKLVETHPFIYLERPDKRTYEEIVAEKLKEEKRKKTKETEGEEESGDVTKKEAAEPEKVEAKEKDIAESKPADGKPAEDKLVEPKVPEVKPVDSKSGKLDEKKDEEELRVVN